MATTDATEAARVISRTRIASSPNSRGYFPAAIRVKLRGVTSLRPHRAFYRPMARNQAPRLRSPLTLPPLHVVLVEPEIPPNTGNVARLCAATSSVLHLVGTLGFRVDDKSVRRAGVDYWHLVDV